MPLVRISLFNGKPAQFGKQVGEIVYQAMRTAISIPEHDHFQVITEHASSSLIYDPAYLDVERTDGFLVIQITLNEGRSLEGKKALYNEVRYDFFIIWPSDSDESSFLWHEQLRLSNELINRQES